MTETSLTIRDDGGTMTTVTVTDIRIPHGADGYADRVIDAIEREFDGDADVSIDG